MDELRLVAVIRATGVEDALQTAERLTAGGVKLLELTFTTPFAHAALAALTKAYKDTDVIVGAGTVLDAASARLAILSGAQFIVSPGVIEEVVKTAHLNSVAVIPGVATATEVIKALELGVDYVKLFPASAEALTALKGPFPNVKFMLTGGVTENNAALLLSKGASALGAGSNLTAEGADIRKWVTLTSKN
jgi:2-dehydro-3-deoxyphosphogluconate aldolase/(4S)-4-hydroxy-2-oxoglutarate aldolase